MQGCERWGGAIVVTSGEVLNLLGIILYLPPPPPPPPPPHNQRVRNTRLTTEMEGVSETRLLTLFRRERFHRLQIEVEVQMQVVQVFAVNQQIQHVVTLYERDGYTEIVRPLECVFFRSFSSILFSFFFSAFFSHLLFFLFVFLSFFSSFHLFPFIIFFLSSFL